MSEWWTYRPSDFLMFAPDTYWRQFELHNEALWPAPPLAALLVLAWLVVVLAAPEGRRSWLLRTGLFALAAATAFAAWSFLWQRYAEILWAAKTFAVGHAVLAAGLLLLALWPALEPTSNAWRWRVGMGVLLWASVAHPLLPWLGSVPLAHAQWLGAAPDPTVLAALGLLLVVRPGHVAGHRVGHWLVVSLRALALAWCLISVTTLWTMGSAQAWLLALPGLLAVGTLLRKA